MFTSVAKFSFHCIMKSSEERDTCPHKIYIYIYIYIALRNKGGVEAQLHTFLISVNEGEW